MKKLSRNSKTGFTLLEVILATAIMAIASTMIMTGFIAVMVMAKNNSLYAKSGQENYRLAMNNLANNAMSASQRDVMTRLQDGHVTTLVSNNSSVPNLYVQVEAYANDDIPVYDSTNALVINGDNIDTTTCSNYRYTFFYDFGDYMGMAASSGHILRWGFMMLDKTSVAADVYNACNPIAVGGVTYTPIFVDKDGDGLVGSYETNDAQRLRELVGYGHYGWYCFNGDPAHFPNSSDPEHNLCPFRAAPYTPTPAGF